MVDPDRIKIFITSAATLTAIGFIALSSLFEEQAVLLLSIEVVLLPSIYIIGSTIVEKTLREQHESDLNEALKKSQELDEKLYKLEKEYQIVLEHENDVQTQKKRYDSISDIPRESPEFKAIKKIIERMRRRGPPRIW